MLQPDSEVVSCLGALRDQGKGEVISMPVSALQRGVVGVCRSTA